MHVDNISDHVPVQLTINYTDSITSSNIVNEQLSTIVPQLSKRLKFEAVGGGGGGIN